MTKFTVNIDSNESGVKIGSYETLEKAKAIAIEYLENTDPKNDNEGINIYTKEGIVMSFVKGESPKNYDPKTGQQL